MGVRPPLKVTGLELSRISYSQQDVGDVELTGCGKSHGALLQLERCNAQIRKQDVRGAELTGGESHGTVLRLGRCNAQKRTWDVAYG